jgi:hypothetical protein
MQICWASADCLDLNRAKRQSMSSNSRASATSWATASKRALFTVAIPSKGYAAKSNPRSMAFRQVMVAGSSGARKPSKTWRSSKPGTAAGAGLSAEAVVSSEEAAHGVCSRQFSDCCTDLSERGEKSRNEKFAIGALNFDLDHRRTRCGSRFVLDETDIAELRIRRAARDLTRVRGDQQRDWSAGKR